jgi:cell division protein FtsB
VKKRVLKYLKNKYILASLVFVAWVTLFNDIDLLYIIECRMEVSSLRREVRSLHEKNEKTKLILSDLTVNKESMEKFARETYFMKRENEDVYVFKERAD